MDKEQREKLENFRDSLEDIIQEIEDSRACIKNDLSNIYDMLARLDTLRDGIVDELEAEEEEEEEETKED